MSPGRIVIVSGPPGAGKSTVARALAERADGPLAVHMHTDDFYVYIRKGFVEPWRPESQAQNIAVMNALAASAAAFAAGGYEVAVDGIVGPWFFEPWLAAAKAQEIDLRYVCLLPAEEETVARGMARTAPGAMTDPKVIRQMSEAFRRFPSPPANVLDTTGEAAEATIERVRSALAAGGLKLT